ncbi:hypothetical protein P7C71_g1242, partial [Lecanoromycetidae sp. Uapishka_2]
MAPDRGSRDEDEEDEGGNRERIGEHHSDHESDNEGPDASLLQRDDAQAFLAEQAEQGQNFTFRGVAVGLAIGVIICFSNMYFGLQTGWVSGMAMPAALIGFGFFKTVARCIDYPFTPVENVLVQTVAGALGTMPLGSYVGQGIIMGPATTLHMLLGALIGWGVLSPLAKSRGWASGPVSDWTTGSKGWIVWVSLAIMLADSVVSLGWLILRPSILYGPSYYKALRSRFQRGGLSNVFQVDRLRKGDYTALTPTATSDSKTLQESAEPDAPEHHLVSNRTVLILFTLSILLCIFSIRYVFPPIPYGAIILSIIMALLLSLMGVRALGETDLNPVSGISKLTQLFFALVIPSSNPNAITINLLAGAISESGALQAGDMMQDLKTGHLLGAAPRAQFWGQMIGSLVGAFVSAGVYKLYTSVYDVPGDMFQVPTAYVWIFTARLVTGKGLPEMAFQWALGAGLVFVVLTVARVRGQGKWWQGYIPGGIAVAVGMYNVPSFTLARTVGGMVNWYWCGYRRREETPVIVLASGLILGEGVVSIVNLGLASLHVPHL